MSDLLCGEPYEYVVGDATLGLWSRPEEVLAPPAVGAAPPATQSRPARSSATNRENDVRRSRSDGEGRYVVALLADEGIARSAATIACLTEQVQEGNVDLIVHAGDISYADNRGQNNSWVWQEYMDLKQVSYGTKIECTCRCRYRYREHTA